MNTKTAATLLFLTPAVLLAPTTLTAADRFGAPPADQRDHSPSRSSHRYVEVEGWVSEGSRGPDDWRILGKFHRTDRKGRTPYYQAVDCSRRHADDYGATRERNVTFRIPIGGSRVGRRPRKSTTGGNTIPVVVVPQGEMAIWLEERQNGQWVEVPDRRESYADREEFTTALENYRRKIADVNAQVVGGDLYRVRASGEAVTVEAPPEWAEGATIGQAYNPPKLRTSATAAPRPAAAPAPSAGRPPFKVLYSSFNAFGGTGAVNELGPYSTLPAARAAEQRVLARGGVYAVRIVDANGKSVR